LDLACVRIKEHLGIITNNTNTAQFDFLISPIKHRAGVSIGDYVLLDHPIWGEKHPVLAIVTQIQSNEDIMGTSHNDRIGKLMATAKTVGYVNLEDKTRQLKKLLVPPNPGSRVHLPCHEFLQDTLSRDINGEPFKQPLYIGKIESNATSQTENLKPLTFYLDANNLTNHHCLIAATDGTGKTHTETVLLEELSNKTETPILILDAFGEYTTINNAKEEIKQITEAHEQKPEKYPFNSTITIYEANPKEPTKKLQQTNIKSIPANWSKTIEEKNILQVEEMLTKELKANKTLIINAKELETDERRILFEQMLTALWKTRTKDQLKNLVLVIEDAETLSGKMLNQIAAEGLKKGVALTLISRHPSELGEKVLSQMTIQIIGRITSKIDLEYLKLMALDKTDTLPQMPPGKWVINGITMRNPIEVVVRELLTKSLLNQSVK
jgi:hypothetical protein